MLVMMISDFLSNDNSCDDYGGDVVVDGDMDTYLGLSY